MIGNYEIVRELGRGGMGIVYEAFEKALDRKVALKILPEESAGDSEFVESFLSEARAAARVSHANIVHVYAVGEDNGIYYIAMEYVEGRTLRQCVTEDGPFEPQRALEIIRLAAQALAEAHRHKIVHRDIKPANIMLTRSGEVKVMDFGLAKMGAGKTGIMSVDGVMGSPLYMSPEQVHGRRLDTRTDIYSLGASLYEMLTATPPYRAATLDDLLEKIVQGPFPDPTEYCTGLLPCIPSLIRKMTTLNPERRHHSADAVIGTIDLCLEELTAHAAPDPSQSTLSGSRDRFVSGAATGGLAPTGLYADERRPDAARPETKPRMESSSLGLRMESSSLGLSDSAIRRASAGAPAGYPNVYELHKRIASYDRGKQILTKVGIVCCFFMAAFAFYTRFRSKSTNIIDWVAPACFIVLTAAAFKFVHWSLDQYVKSIQTKIDELEDPVLRHPRGR